MPIGIYRTVVHQPTSTLLLERSTDVAAVGSWTRIRSARAALATRTCCAINNKMRKANHE